ncbi:MAG: hypothetical protein QGF16_00210, partial [Rhodospirillales bacterium]|nr:hypothetical protein [Rhodospirillales bacterium]
MINSNLIRIFGATAIAALVLGAAEVSAADFYAGKTLKIVTNASAGGSTGISSQTFANWVVKYIPGSPKVIVQPVPGGAQLKGINFVRNARADGLTIGWSAWGGSTRVLDPPKRQVPFHEFQVIGGAGIMPVVIGRTDLGGGIKSAEDLVKVGKVKYGGFRPGSAFDMRARLSLEMLGIDYSYVSGYRGAAPGHAALLRGEINLQSPSMTAFLAVYKKGSVADGKTLGLFYWGLPNKDGTTTGYKEAAEMPTFYKLYSKLKGKAPSGAKWEAIKFLSRASDGLTWLVWAPPKTPADRVAILRKAFADAVKDPGFLADYEKRTKL